MHLFGKNSMPDVDNLRRVCITLIYSCRKARTMSLASMDEWVGVFEKSSQRGIDQAAYE